MTTADTKLNTDSDSVAVKTRSEDYFVFPDPQDVFPDPPDRTPEEMTTYRHLNYFGIPYLLRQHFGAPDTTIVDSEHYITPTPPKIIDGLRFPDLLIAFDADPSALARDNAYVISDQGKPPDFVLEIASRSTGHIDTGQKRDGLRFARHPGVLAFRRDGRVSRHPNRRRSTGGRALRADRDRGSRGRHLGGIQHRPAPEPPLGTRRVEVARPRNWRTHPHLRERTRKGGSRTRIPPARTSPRRRRQCPALTP